MVANIILGYILPLVLLIVAGYLVKVYRSDEVVKWVKVAVKAAEQIYNGSGQGKEKFAYVSEWISKKFKVSEIDLKNIIESAVYELNNTEAKE
jgi:hypothetical protein